MEKLQINSITKKLSKGGKIFWSVETSNGKMTCWDLECAQGLELMVNKIVEAEVSEKDGFKTIKSFTPSADKPTLQSMPNKVSSDDRALLMELSYAKDVLVALLLTYEKGTEDKAANTAIALIKQMKKGLAE